MSTAPLDARALATALQQAALADERETLERARDEARRLVRALASLVRGTRASDTAALSAPARELAQALSRLLDAAGQVRLELRPPAFEVNGLVLVPTGDDAERSAQLVQELLRHQLDALVLHAPLDEAGAITLAQALAEPAGRPGRTLVALNDRFVGPLAGVEAIGRPVDAAEETTNAFLLDPWMQAASFLRRAHAALAAGRLPDLRELRRSASRFLQAVREQPDRALATPLWEPALAPGERHILAVTSLSLRLGQRLGFEPAALQDLAVALLLRRAGALGHPHGTELARGLERLAAPRGFHVGKLRRLLLLLDELDPIEGDRAHVFARMLAITRDYDVLTWGVSGSKLAPPLAQGALWAARGTRYDPDLLALFVQTLGLYPPGSLLELNDGRAAVSVSGGRSAERFAWPKVVIVRGPDGPGAQLDLFDARDSLKPKRVLGPGAVELRIDDIFE